MSVAAELLLDLIWSALVVVEPEFHNVQLLGGAAQEGELIC